MRERVEDLGRLAVLIGNLYEHDLFSMENWTRRPKDCAEWFESLPAQRKEELLSIWAYGVVELREKISEMLEIANGTDSLNQEN